MTTDDNNKKDENHYGSLFSYMLSLPLKKNMSKVDSFTQWSGVLLYVPIGLASVCIPDLLGGVFQIRPGQYGSGMTRVMGMQLASIGFLYWVFTRTKPRLSSEPIVLGTTVERIFYVSGTLYSIYRRNLIPPLMLLNVGVTDFVLSVITLAVWFKTSPSASLTNYISSVARLVLFGSKSNYSSHVVHLLGLVQFTCASAFLIRPATGMELLQISHGLHPHQQGLLLMVMLASGAMGSLNIFAGGADCKAYNIGLVFYTLCCAAPLVGFLGWMDLIPVGLAGYLLCVDGVGAVLTALALCMD